MSLLDFIFRNIIATPLITVGAIALLNGNHRRTFAAMVLIEFIIGAAVVLGGPTQ
jgi:hypothetical protein